MTERNEVLDDADFAPAKAVKPASRWRNRAWFHREVTMDGKLCRAGELYEWGNYSTKTIAEAKALKWLSKPDVTDGTECVRDFVSYLGAFPEGDA